MIKQLISFYKRRIHIPVNKSSLVLDIGSGDKPHWRSDVLLDKYIDEKFGSQRSGNKKTTISRPIFDSDADSTPFKDKAFDFVICSHLLEHVENPGNVIKEIMRIGKSGYIEVPYEGSSKIYDFPTHLWYCKKNNNKLIFTAKNNTYLDNEIEKFINSEIKKEVIKLFNKNFDNCIVKLYWNDKIDYEIIGNANLEILKQPIDIKYGKILFILRNLINSFFQIIYFYKKRKKHIMINDILKDEIKYDIDEKLDKKIYKI